MSTFDASAEEEAVNQCEAQFVVWMVLAIAAQFVTVFFRRGNTRIIVSVCYTFALLGLIMAATKGVPWVTLIHEVIGMICFELAMSTVTAPMVVVTSRLGLFLALSGSIAMVPAILGEAIAGPIGEVHSFGAGFRDSSFWAWYQDTELYRKQHVLLTSALAMLSMSIASSYRISWRHSFQMQLMRMFIEPSCIVIAAMIVVNHDHRTEAQQVASPKPATHPAEAVLTFLAALSQVVCNAMHMSHPKLWGRELPDLARPLQNGGPPSLIIWRCVTVFFLLLNAHFLYILTFFQYALCRKDLFGELGDRRHQGYSLGGEVGTYLAYTLMITVFVFPVVVLKQWPTPANGGYLQLGTVGELTRVVEPALVGCGSDDKKHDIDEAIQRAPVSYYFQEESQQDTDI
jgi:hypothetical protein